MGNESVARKKLVAKLAEAVDAVGGVEKKGRNEHQRYAYVKAADVAKAIRHELFKRGIILETNERKLEEQMITTVSGANMRYVTLTVEYTLRDESDWIGPFQAFGTAMDAGDKALWKAKTGALKYFLRGLGIIPDELDDPEADETVDENVDQRVYVENFEKRDKKAAKIAEFQRRAFDSACSQSGKTTEQISIYLKSKFAATRSSDLTKAEFNDAIKWAVGAPEHLAEHVAESLKAIRTRKGPQPVVPSAEMQREDDPMAGD